jgi:hypothetical protein
MTTTACTDNEWSNPWTTDEVTRETATPSGIYLKAEPEIQELGRLLDQARRGWAKETADDPLLGDDTFEPRHERRLRDLEQEHHKLLSWGELLYQTGRAFDGDGLRLELDRFTAALAAHEEAQVELLQDALLTDIGIVD